MDQDVDANQPEYQKQRSYSDSPRDLEVNRRHVNRQHDAEQCAEHTAHRRCLARLFEWPALRLGSFALLVIDFRKLVEQRV